MVILFLERPYKWTERSKTHIAPGREAIIGGGLGSKYQHWARQEFIRRQRKSNAGKSPEEIQRFKELRSPETFLNLAVAARLSLLKLNERAG